MRMKTNHGGSFYTSEMLVVNIHEIVYEDRLKKESLSPEGGCTPRRKHCSVSGHLASRQVLLHLTECCLLIINSILISISLLEELFPYLD